MECVVGGFHVGAVGPGTASAIEDDGLVAREGLDAGAQALQRRWIGGGPDIFRAGDVGLRIEHVRSDMNEKWLAAFWRLQNLDQFVDGDRVGHRDLAGLECDGYRDGQECERDGE